MAESKEISASDELLVGFLEALISFVPAFAKWLGGVLAKSDADDAVTRRVRDILPERSASEEVAERLRGGT